MPLRKSFATADDPILGELSERLTQEWHSPQEDAREPLIDEVSDEKHTQPTRLRVIWDAWQGLSDIERSVVIMQAYANVGGWTESMYVISAEGLTFEEAKRYGVSLEG